MDLGQNTRMSLIEGVDSSQNTRLNAIETINTNQNTSISIIQGVDNTQNTNITNVTNNAAAAFTKANSATTLAQAAFDKANTNSNSIVTLQAVNVTQNTNITNATNLAQAAYNTANSSSGSINFGAVTGNVTQRTIVVPTSGIDINTEIITYANHGFATGDAVTYSTNGGTVLGGLSDDTIYYIRALTANTFSLYDNYNNSINLASTSGRKNLTGTGNNLQSFTYGNVYLNLDCTGNNRIFYENITPNFAFVDLNLLLGLSDNQATKLQFVVSGLTDKEADLIVTKVNGSTVTGATLNNSIKRNTTNIFSFMVVKFAGVYTIYNY